MTVRALLALSVAALAVSPAFSADDPPGARRMVDFSVTWLTKGKSAINHAFKGTCEMIVGTPQETNLDGQGGNASRQQTSQDLAKEMQACGSDVQCMQRVAQKVQASGVVNIDKNYVIWGPLSCSGMSLSADDTVVEQFDDGGEGGVRMINVTTTTKGAAQVPTCGNCLQVQYDLKKGMTEYRFGQPLPPAEFLQTQSGRPMNDAPRKVTIKAFADVPAPTLAGPPQNGKVIRPVPGGEVTFQWTIKR